MSKLNLKVATRRLAEADEMRAVSVAKVKQPDREAGPVRVKTGTTPKLTKITQIDGPKLTLPKENSKTGLKIPQAEDGGTAVHKAPRMTFKNAKHGTQGGLKNPSIKSVKKPSSEMREVGDTIKRTEAGGGFGQGAEFISGKVNGSRITVSGGVGLKSGSNDTPTVPKVNAKTIGPESPGAGKVTVKAPGEGKGKTIPQIKKPEGFQSEPSDGGDRKTSFPTVESVRSGVQVRLGNKVKAEFGLAHPAMLERMVESYRQHGYQLKIVGTGQASWKKDRTLLKTIWESIDAEFNFVPEEKARLRRTAMNRLSQISQVDYNSLYESRQEFVDTIVAGFNQIEGAVRKRYTESLELMLCNVRFIVDGKVVDAEITTEAHSPNMALRQIKNLLQENYGLETRIVHVFVDGAKFSGDSIPVWNTKS